VRVRLLAVAVAILLSLAVAPASARAWSLRSLDGRRARVVTEINRVRSEHRLSALRISSPLRRAAAQHVYEMAVLGYFSHSSPNRPSVAARLTSYYTWRGYAAWHVGETLLWSAAPLSARAIVRLWLNSPEHRRVLLDPRFREVGIDATEVSDAGGVFGGRNVLLVAADFGVRS
jgi:uncharacterized protein YkwD